LIRDLKKIADILGDRLDRQAFVKQFTRALRPVACTTQRHQPRRFIGARRGPSGGEYVNCLLPGA
jgi:hypothetical protein